MNPAPLRKNHGGYRGETIEIGALVERCAPAAKNWGWVLEDLDVGFRMPVRTLRRRRSGNASRLYVSAGAHGDEPAGPLTVLGLLEEDSWPSNTDLWLCPCLNPSGFPLNRRENAAGIDLNRDYRHFRSPETRAHTQWLARQPDFHCAVCLHEDWEASGFYLYELNLEGRPSHAEAMVRAVAAVCPIESAEVIGGRRARGGIIRPEYHPRQRPQWPEAFYLAQHKTRHSYTLEAPSDYPLEVRTRALRAAMGKLCELIERRVEAAYFMRPLGPMKEASELA
jgi:predicted deacylase